MLSRWNLCLIVATIIIGSLSGLDGFPADPAASAVPAAPVAPVAAAPPVATAPVQPAAVAPGQEPVGGGVVTEHKNPDGSIITVTRFNGPLPEGAFRNQFAGILPQALHDNYYQTQQLLQLQQAMLLRNIQLLNYYRSPTYLPTYVYSPVAGPFLTPYFGFGYPFASPYGQGRAAKSVN